MSSSALKGIAGRVRPRPAPLNLPSSSVRPSIEGRLTPNSAPSSSRRVFSPGSATACSSPASSPLSLASTTCRGSPRVLSPSLSTTPGRRFSSLAVSSPSSAASPTIARQMFARHRQTPGKMSKEEAPLSAVTTPTAGSRAEKDFHLMVGLGLGAVLGLFYGPSAMESAFLQDPLFERQKIDIQKKGLSMNDFYTLGQQIGEGAYGEVRAAVEKATGRVAAVKTVSHHEAHCEASAARESRVLQKLRRWGGHPNIVELRDVFEEEEKTMLVTEYLAGGELFDNLIQHGVLKEKLAKKIILQVASALDFLHKHNLVHKDVKLENLMLTSVLRDGSGGDGPDDDADVQVKLVDFGSAGFGTSLRKKSTVANSGNMNNNTSTNNGNGSMPKSVPAAHVTAESQDADDEEDEYVPSGTLAYLPPETILCNACDKEMDLWALGCVLYILLSGSHPFDLDGTGDDRATLRKVLKQQEINFEGKVWANVSEEAKSLIRQLLNKDPRKRISAEGVLQSEWLRELTRNGDTVGDSETRAQSVLEEQATVGSLLLNSESRRELQEMVQQGRKRLEELSETPKKLAGQVLAC